MTSLDIVEHTAASESTINAVVQCVDYNTWLCRGSGGCQLLTTLPGSISGQFTWDLCRSTWKGFAGIASIIPCQHHHTDAA